MMARLTVLGALALLSACGGAPRRILAGCVSSVLACDAAFRP